MIYEIKVQLKNCPVNMKFYADSRKTRLLERSTEQVNGETVDVITISRYLSLNMVGEEPNKHTEVDDVHNETIYWDWPYQTLVSDGQGGQNSVPGDTQDTLDSGKTVEMSIVATGIQVTGNPNVLANLVKVGDYVNYDANSNGTHTYNSSNYISGVSVSEEFTTAETVKWRVLSVDKETQKIILVADDPIAKKEDATQTKTVTLTLDNGYKNSIQALNAIGSIYGHGKGAEEGRSINLDDIMQYSNFNPKTEYNASYSSTGRVGGTRQYESGTFIVTEEKYVDENGEEHEIITGGTDNENGTVTASYTKPVTVIQTDYDTENETITKNSFTEKDSINGETIYDMLFKRPETTNKDIYWVASRSVSLAPPYCTFYVHFVNNGYIGGGALINSYRTGALSGLSHRFVPVVVLQSNIETTGQEDGVWQLKVD